MTQSESSFSHADELSQPDLVKKIVLPMKPLYRRLIRLASLMLVLAGASAPGLVMWQAMTGQISKFSLIVLIAGFPYLVLCLFCSHLLARFTKFNQLELEASGLRWRTPFFRVETSWDNLLPLSDSERPGLVGLLTREPVGLTGLGPFTLLPRTLRGIPSGFFGELAEGELAQALARFAPELNPLVPDGLPGSGTTRE